MSTPSTSESHPTAPARPTTLFIRDGTSTYAPTAATHGPWSQQTLHGGPVAALVAHGALQHRDDPDVILSRLTVDMPRAAPATPLTLATEVLRSGRRVTVIAATLTAEGQTVAHGQALLLRASSEPTEGLAQSTSVISDLEAAEPAGLAPEPLHHANCIELRRAEAGAYWVNLDIAMIEGTPLEPAERAALAADWANPAANFAPGGIGYINPDITLCLHRQPAGTWLGIGPATRNSTAGIAISDCPLTDREGVAGRCLTSGLAAGFTTDAPGRDGART